MLTPERKSQLSSLFSEWLLMAPSKPFHQLAAERGFSHEEATEWENEVIKRINEDIEKRQ